MTTGDLLASDSSQLRYDAFISYSRRDLPFARQLEATLRAYRPPKDLAVPQRYIRVFRDESDITGEEYKKSITRALTAAAKLIVVCSPNSASSRFVEEEIDLFNQHRGKEHIIPLLLDGIPNNEVTENTVDERAFPEALVRLLPMPLAADYRGFDPARDKVNKGRFTTAWFKTLADIYADYGIDREKIEQRERRRVARRRRNIAMVSAAVAAIVIALGIVALRNRATSEARRLAGEAQRQLENADQSGDSLAKSVLLAVSSVRSARTVDGHIVLTASMGLLSRPPQWRQVLEAMSPQQGTASRQKALAFSADGARIAATDGRGAVHVLDARSGQIVRSIDVKRRFEQFAALAFSPDGTRVIVSCGHQACVLDMASGRELTRLSPADGRPNGTLWSVVFSPDGRMVATSSYHSNVVSIYNTSDWTLSGKIVDQRGSSGVFSLAFSPNGEWLATGTSGIHLWRVGRYDAPAAQVSASGVIWSVHFWPDGESLIAAGGTLQSWKITSTGEDADPALERKTLPSREAQAVLPVLWHGMQCLVTMAETIRVLCGAELTEVARLPIGTVNAIVSADGRSLAAAQGAGELALWSLDAGIETARVNVGAPILAMAIAEQHGWLAAGTGKRDAEAAGEVVVLELDTWRERTRLPLPSSITMLAASAAGQWLAVAAGNGLHIYDTVTWRELKALTYENAVTRVHFTARDRSLVVVHGETVVTLQPQDWSQRVLVEPQQEGDLRAVRTSPDGGMMAITWHWSGGHDTGVEWRRVFDLHNGNEIAWEFSAPGGSNISEQAMKGRAAEANRELTGGDVKTVEASHSWFAREPEERVSGDDQWSVKVSGSRLELTDKPENRVIGLLSHLGDIAGAYFLPSPAPRWIVSGGEDGTLAVWPLRVGDLADQACTRLRGLMDAATLSKLAADAGAGQPCPAR